MLVNWIIACLDPVLENFEVMVQFHPVKTVNFGRRARAGHANLGTVAGNRRLWWADLVNVGSFV
jgi:hypothetical protein